MRFFAATRRFVRPAVVVIACSVPVVASQQSVNRDAEVMADFTARIGKYVELRKKADDDAPKLKETQDPAKIRMGQQTLAERIRSARAGAKQGDIFSPEISAQFRKLLKSEAKAQGTKAAIHDDNPGKLLFNINGPYPDKEPLATVPPNVLQSLPPLPKDVDYRFVSKHLILRDSRANLIIDYIPNAIS